MTRIAIPVTANQRDSGPLRRADTGLPDAVRVLLVGAGRRGVQVHIPALQAMPEVEIAAIVDVPERVSAIRAALPAGVPVFGSMARAMAERPVNLGIIATPHDTHCRLIARLLERRVPALVEKPPVRDGTRLRQLIESAARSGIAVATILPLRFDPRHLSIRSILHRSRAGPIELEVAASVPAYSGVNGWRHSPGAAGGGVLLDLGYHYVDLFIHLAGVPDAIELRVGDFHDAARRVESYATARLWYSDIETDVRLRLDARPGAQRSRVMRWRTRGSRQEPWRYVVNEERSYPQSHQAGRRLLTAFIRHRLLCGFLHGHGSWLAELEEQSTVMNVIGQMYASATRSEEMTVGVI